jgi:hypothetical protein
LLNSLEVPEEPEACDRNCVFPSFLCLSQKNPQKNGLLPSFAVIGQITLLMFSAISCKMGSEGNVNLTNDGNSKSSSTSYPHKPTTELQPHCLQLSWVRQLGPKLATTQIKSIKKPNSSHIDPNVVYELNRMPTCSVPVPRRNSSQQSHQPQNVRSADGKKHMAHQIHYQLVSQPTQRYFDVSWPSAPHSL